MKVQQDTDRMKFMQSDIDYVAPTVWDYMYRGRLSTDKSMGVL